MQQSEHVTGSVLGIAACTAMILETNNLRGGADLAQALAGGKRLVAALVAQTPAPQPVAEWIITHDGFSEQACAGIAGLAGFPIDFVLIGSAHRYYEAKNLGFDRPDPLRCDCVAFCDADCTPAAQWLEQLLVPFTGPEGSTPLAVAGRASYSASVMGIALTSIHFMYFPERCAWPRRSISTPTMSPSGTRYSINTVIRSCPAGRPRSIITTCIERS
jgi:hypothetical protein